MASPTLTEATTIWVNDLLWSCINTELAKTKTKTNDHLVSVIATSPIWREIVLSAKG